MRYFKLFLLSILTQALSADPLIQIVTAVDSYQDIAKKIGGKYVETKSLIHHDDGDGHQYSLSPKDIKSICNARIVVINGLYYDDFFTPYLNKKQEVILIEKFLKNKIENPHLWYDLVLMKDYAKKIAEVLQQIDPAHAKRYQENYRKFQAQHQKLLDEVASIKKKIPHMNVMTTESVCNLMLEKLGFQISMPFADSQMICHMSPSPASMRNAMKILKDKKVQLLIYNKKIHGAMLQELVIYAKKQNIPVIDVEESMPEGMSYHEWMFELLNDIKKNFT